MSEQEIKNALHDGIMAGTDSDIYSMYCFRHHQYVIVTRQDATTGNLKMYENGCNYLETLNPRNIPSDIFRTIQEHQTWYI